MATALDRIMGRLGTEITCIYEQARPDHRTIEAFRMLQSGKPVLMAGIVRENSKGTPLSTVCLLCMGDEKAFGWMSFKLSPSDGTFALYHVNSADSLPVPRHTFCLLAEVQPWLLSVRTRHDVLVQLVQDVYDYIAEVYREGAL